MAALAAGACDPHCARRPFTCHQRAAEMKPRKPKPNEPSLLQELNEPLRDFVADFKLHGKSALEQVRERSPEKYLELSTKLLPLVAALNPGTNDFSDANDMQSIGVKLLQSVGFIEPDDASIQAAIALNDRFIDDLQAIFRNAATEPMQ
jgi:hypothetical protein